MILSDWLVYFKAACLCLKKLLRYERVIQRVKHIFYCTVFLCVDNERKLRKDYTIRKRKIELGEIQ